MVPLSKILLSFGIFAIALILIVLFLSRNRQVEGFGALDNRNDFAARQNSYFGSKFNRALFYNSGLESAIKDAAKMFSIVDPLMSKNGPTDISNYFDRDPLPGNEARNAQCENVLEPRFLPERDPKTKAGCGWWYVDDDAKASVGSNGTEIGPYDSDGLEKRLAGGRWVWDLKEAQKLEDIKRCRRIKTCDTADLVPGRCGFCPALNSGVPVHGNGVSVYEDDPALNCGSTAITNPANCPRPEPPATPDGAPQPQVALLCDPNPATGKLSNECLITLARGAGLTDEGAVIHILAGDANGYITRPGPKAVQFDLAKRILKGDTSIVVGNEFLGIGSCTRGEALGFYNTLFRLSRTASTIKAKNAAGFLAFGKEFDECDIDEGDTGPFEQHCLERAAREAGCQPDGTDYPKSNNKGNYDAMNWRGVLNFFAKLRADMNSTDIETQIATTKRCLGVDVQRPAADCGDFAGMSMYVYKWEYEWDIGQGDVPGGKISRATYFGRVITPTYPEINNNGAFTPFNIGTDRLYLRMKAKIKSKETITTRFWVYTDDGIAINVGDMMNGPQNVLRKWWDQGPTGYDSAPFTIRPNQPLEVTTDWFNNYGGYVAVHRMWQAGSNQPIPANIVEQVQPTGFPIARWDFYEGIINDRCRVLDSQVIGTVPIVTRGGAKGAQFEGDNYIKIHNALGTTAFKSITMMMYVNSNPGPWPRPWEFNNSNLGKNPNSGDGNWCQDSLFGCISPNNNMGIGFYSKLNCGGPEIWSGGGTMTTQKWFHVAWVLDDDMRGMSIYIDGNLMKRFRSESFNLLQNKVFRNCYIFQSVERFYKDVCVAWFRIFDYSMTKEDVALDRRNGWFNDQLFPVSTGTGWERNSVSYTKG